MKTLILSIFLFSTYAFCAENTQKDLSDQIAEMAVQLETEDPEEVKAFILTYADLGKTREPITTLPDQMVERFMAKKQARLRTVLHHVKDKKADEIRSDVEYVYEIEDPEISKPKITFVYHSEKKIFLIKN